jgi:2-polyprenyl-6-methoxyphenol hydroxylase-like FAD-dependent oxidoreductase
LSSAITLARHGGKVSVVELQRDVEGTSIGIMHRAVDALRELGVLEDCMACGLVFRGRPLLRGDTRLPQGIMMYRPELVRILREMAEQHGVQVDVGVGVAGLLQRDSQVDVTFEDGRRELFDLVIGADGTQSSVRASIRSDVRPVYTGCMSFRWLARAGVQPTLGYHSAGPGVSVTIGRLPEQVTYVAVGVDMEQRAVDPLEAREIVAHALARVSAPGFAELRAALDTQQQILVRPFEWILVPPPWHRGQIVLIGDAVHTAVPHWPGGAGMALEDGCVLGQELARSSDLSTALASFTRRRAARTQFVVEAGLKLLELQRAHADRQAIADARRTALEVFATPY